MKITIKRRAADEPEPTLFEIVPPRGSTSVVAPAENFLAALSHIDCFSLELAASRGARWILARTAEPLANRLLEEQLQASYPQAEMRCLDTVTHPGLDPMHVRDGEQVAVCTLGLDAEPYLPLRTFS